VAEADENRTHPPGCPGAPVLKTGRDTSPHSPPNGRLDIACLLGRPGECRQTLTLGRFLSDTGEVRGGKVLRSHSERGFTLIELLVVIVIIAILAAIGIPIYLNQREKAQITSIQSTLKNVANFVESAAVDQAGDYSTLDNKPATVLTPEGYRPQAWSQTPGYITIEANATHYCIEAQHAELSPSNTWRRSTYDSLNPRPVESPDICPDL
jgi:type IV pilus assembly protein PilA